MKIKIIIFSLSLLFASCDKDYYYIKKINIKGKISQSSKIESMRVPTSSNAYKLADATKVLIFYGNEYDLVNIKSDGTFSGKAPLGSATAIAFLTKNNEFIGNLFCGGMNLLPLVGIDEDVSVIDFSTLTLDGTRVIPENDPIGKTIILSEEEKDFIREIGAYYEALAKNIDMNNDGEPDVLQGGYIFMNTIQNFRAGKWGINGEKPELLPKAEFGLNYQIWMVGPIELVSSKDNSIPENATLSGPTGNPLADIRNAGNSYSNSKEFKLNFARGGNSGSFLPFSSGEYKLTIDNKKFTFNYSNVNTLNHWVLVIPTLHTKSSNMVTNITLEYKLPDGQTVDPRKLMRTGLQFEITNANYQQILEIRSKESSPTDLDYDYYNIVLETPLKLSDIGSIGIGYTDIFGNQCGNGWNSVLYQN